MVRKSLSLTLLLIFLTCLRLFAAKDDTGVMFRIDDDLGFFQEGQVMFAFGFERPEDTHFLDSLSNYTPEEFSFFVDRKPVWVRVLLNNPNSSDVGATIRLLQPNTKENVVLLHNGKKVYQIVGFNLRNGQLHQ